MVCFFFIAFWHLPSWLPPQSRNPPIDIRTFVINYKDFPPGWVIKRSEPYPPNSSLDWGEMNWNVGFQPVDYQGFFEQSVFKFRNQLAAIYGEYRIVKQGYLYDSSNGRNVEMTSYKSPFADSWKLDCYKGENDIRVCNVIARYDEYVTYFLITSPKSRIKTKDIEEILSEIDTRIATTLGYFR